MSKNNAVTVTPSAGNVFRDPGFSKEKSEHLVIRADLWIQVQKAIASRSLKQAEAAKVLWVTQPRVSDLLRGRIDLFSTDAYRDAGEAWRGRQAGGQAEEIQKSRVKKNQLVNVALGEKLSALRTEEYFAERAARGVIKKALQVLKRAGQGNPPVPVDERVSTRVRRRHWSTLVQTVRPRAHGLAIFAMGGILSQS